MNKLNCPVCKRSQIEGDRCPNCETDLATYGMLSRLPIQTSVAIEDRKSFQLFWLSIGIAVLFLLLGFGLGINSNSIIAQDRIIKSPANSVSSIAISQPKLDKSIASTIAQIPQQIVKSQSEFCGGFNYTVRRGDSLSLIARRFYGDSSLWSLISKANPTVRGRENSIEINELLSIPNLTNTCTDN